MGIVRENQGGSVLVVSHKATTRLLLGFDPRRYRDSLDQSPSARNVVDFKSPVRARLPLFNDTSHYDKAPRRADRATLEVVGRRGSWVV